jgi:pimeloyl-ACP methyl ester carboxylesterase
MKLGLTILVLSIASLLGAGAWLYTPDKSRAVLEAKYAGSPAEFVQVAGLRLHVRDTGPKDAPVLILLHGFGSSLQTWEAWAELLSHTYRVVRFDLPGFGLTGPDPAGDYSDARNIHVLSAVMQALSVDRATLIGNSLGGRIAWTFAAENPHRVEKLTLISPDGFASRGFQYGKKVRVPAFVRLLPYVLPTSLVRMNLAPAYGDNSALTDDVVARYRDLMLAPGVRRAMIARMEQAELEPPEPLLQRIRVPTLLIWGERDAMIPFGNAGDYMKAVRDCRLVSFPELGHVPQEEAPARSLAPVEEFLAQ